jgi:hypothetical protein
LFNRIAIIFANILLTNFSAPLITKSYSSFKTALRIKTKNHHFVSGDSGQHIKVGNGVQVVAGSNPATPTSISQH